MPGKFFDIGKMRMASQQLGYTGIRGAAEMVGWFGAVQGQEYAQTKWGVALRSPAISDDVVEKELTNGILLRTHLLRPTWHIVKAADISWLLTLTAGRVNAINAFMYRQVELDSRIFKKCNKIIEKVLLGNQHLTREEINNHFRQHKIQAEGHRLSYIMMQAELDGLVCSGARRGNQFTYALLSERLKNTESFTGEEALAELSRRYFQSRGPATVKDFSTWSGLTITACSRGIGMINSSLEKITVNSSAYYYMPSSTHKTGQGKIWLLPVYDEYIMGYKDRSACFEFKQRVQPNLPLQYDCMILYEGQIIGTWKRTIGNKQIEFYYQIFQPFNSKQQKAFDKAVKWLGDFNKMPVVLHPLQ